MPAVNILLRWPDGAEELCYSPSTVVYDYFKIGENYTLRLSHDLKKERL